MNFKDDPVVIKNPEPFMLPQQKIQGFPSSIKLNKPDIQHLMGFNPWSAIKSTCSDQQKNCAMLIITNLSRDENIRQ